MDRDDCSVVFKRAGKLLAGRAYSRAELRNKLVKIAPASQVDLVLDRLQQLNLLNDEEYAYNFALSRIQRDGWSVAKVRVALIQREIGPDVVESVIERVRGELDLRASLEQYVRKRLSTIKPPIGPRQVHKLVLHLRGRGHDQESIKRALKQNIPKALLRQLEIGE